MKAGQVQDDVETRLKSIEHKLADMLPKIVKVLDILFNDQQALDQRLKNTENGWI